MRNKRSNIQNLGFAMVILFVMAIVFLTVKYSYSEVVNRIINNTVVNSSTESVRAFTNTRDLTNRYDYIMFILLMGFTLSIFVIAWFSSGHPLFAFVYFIALVLLIAVSAVLSFVWETITDLNMFATTASTFPITNLILDNFPVYIVIMGFVGMLIMFAKPMFYAVN